MVWGAAGGLCAAAAAVDLVEVAAYRALDPREAHGHALVLVALERRWPQHLALLALLEPLAILEGLTRPREVDLLSYRVAARQRRWWLAAYLCAHAPHIVGVGWEEGQLGGGELWVAAWRRRRRTELRRYW